MSAGKIYMVSCKETSQKYVGLTTATLNQRWTEHKSSAKTAGRNTKLSNAIRKYGADSFEISLLENVFDESKLPEREIYWIAFFDTFRNGYNLTSGGEVGKVWSEESRKKVSVANLGMKRDQEFKRLAAIRATGRKHSDLTKKKMSNWQIGKAKPLSAIENNAKARRMKFCVDGVSYSGFKSAAKVLGVNPCTVARRLKRGVTGYSISGSSNNV